MFGDLLAELDQCGCLEAMRCLDRHVLITLDGTEFHCSDKIHWPPRSSRRAITGSCRWNQSSLYLRTATTSRIVKVVPRGDGWRRGARYVRFNPGLARR